MPPALIVAATGLGLVLGVVGVLWLGLHLLVRLTTERPAPAPAPSDEAHLRYCAAAAAVAVALSQSPPGDAHPLPAPPTAHVSPWQAALRAAQLGRSRPRR